MICHWWFFNLGFKFQYSVCNGSRDLTIFCLDISDIAIITVKNVDYCCIIHSSSKSEAINLLKNSVLENRGYIYKIFAFFSVYSGIYIYIYIYIYICWLFCFVIYKMVDNEYNMDIYKSVKISIGVVMRNPNMLKFVPDHLKTKKMCKHEVKKLRFINMFLIDIRHNKCVIKLF